MATGQQNIDIGSADNANDGDVLRAAFRKVRKMFAEIYGDTDAENLTDTETVPTTNFDTHITEKIEDTVGAMFSGGTQTNVTVTYDDSDGTIDLNVAADITDVNAGSGLTGTNEDGGAATLNVGAGDGITVNADDVALASSVAGSGLTYTSGVLSVDQIDTDGIADDAINGTKLEQFTDTLSASTDGHVLIASGGTFSHFAMTGDVTINGSGQTSIGAGKVGTSNMVSGSVTTTVLGADAVTGAKIADDAVDTEHIADDAIDHAALAPRYTAVQSISDTTNATQNLDASSYSVFNFTADRTKDTTLNVQNMKTGQVIDVHGLSGSYTITLSSDDTSETFNKVGGVDYDGAEDNHLQIVCIDDTDSAAIYNYAIGTYTSDTTP